MENLPLLRHTWRISIFVPRKPEENSSWDWGGWGDLVPSLLPHSHVLPSVKRLSVSRSDDPLALHSFKLSLTSFLSTLQDFILFKQNNASDLRFSPWTVIEDVHITCRAF